MSKLVFLVGLTFVFLTFVTEIYTKNSGGKHPTIRCALGNYHNDGCTICECDTQTGVTQCKKTGCLEMPRSCPQGLRFKDKNGNKCSCFAETGAVYCSIVKLKPDKKMTSFNIKNRKLHYNLTSAQKQTMEKLMKSYLES